MAPDQAKMDELSALAGAIEDRFGIELRVISGGNSANLDWATNNGGRVVRHNLANDPLAFAENDAVKQFLQLSGSAGSRS